jgi:voltage-gated potassium channel
MTRIKEFCREFFYGTSERGTRGRYIMLTVDLLIVLYFVITTFMPYDRWMLYTDTVIGVLLVIELVGRVIADSDKMGLLSKPLALLDIAIIVSLFLPWFMTTQLGTFSFLRVVRAMRVLRSYNVTSKLKRQFRFFAHNEDVIFSALNLMIFIFIVTAFVFVLQQDNDSINNYVDALYFTITTLTTTGFGDVVLDGSDGKLLSILIMIVGVALFIRLVQTIFKPNKVRYECPQCGLTRHDLDAVHCKHCGHELHIRTEGVY